MKTDYLTRQLGRIMQSTRNSDNKYSQCMDIEEITGIKPIKWNRAQIQRATSPLVYIFWCTSESKRVPLYIGMSSLGLSRPLAEDHHMRWARERSDELEFIPCITIKDARDLEKSLIKKLAPIYNDKNNCF